MTLYAKAALQAVERCLQNPTISPVIAWEEAVARFTHSASSRRKSCPRNTFLGLCELGAVKGIERGEYLRDGAGSNQHYAISAVEHLRSCAAPSRTTAEELWQRVIGVESKQANGQMEIVIALWNAGYLV